MTRLTWLLLSMLTFAVGGPALAQDKYPSKPVKILVPYAPGGATDIVARIVGEQMRQSLRQSFVVENKPGAFGIIAIEEMARARPDGYTIEVGNVSTNAIKAGKLKPIAVVSHQRLPDYPDVPTMQEIGFPGVGTIAWNAMFAPAATPKPVLDTLYKAAVDALATPAARDALSRQNFIIDPS